MICIIETALGFISCNCFSMTHDLSRGLHMTYGRGLHMTYSRGLHMTYSMVTDML